MLHLSARSLIVMQALAALTVSSAVSAQQPYPANAAAVTGTYGLDTRELPSLSRDGCWLEVAPSNADSVRVQVLCIMPPPSSHIGVMDENLRFHSGMAAYETDQFSGHCRIAIRFANAHAIVTQDGGAAECGFGANVNVSGTYGRITSGRPKFDLAPIERSSRK